MTRDEIIEISKKYFSMSKAEVEKYLEKFLKPKNSGAVHIDFARDVSESDKQRYIEKESQSKKISYPEDNFRLQHILSVVAQYCEPFIDKADEKLRRKVGKVIFSKLDFSKFGTESAFETKTRLNHLFSSIVSRNVNPYKVIYCSVLTDGNLKIDFENNNREYAKTRDFLVIYDTLKRTLQLTDEETIALFEKCSTLISKVSADRIKKIFDFVGNLSVGYHDYHAKIFDKNEVFQILKINPSLFTVSREKMLGAIKYMEEKVVELLKDGMINLYSNQALNFVANKRQMLRSWIKNNTSLLSINADSMRAKEYFLNESVLPYVHRSYVNIVEKAFAKIFCDRINMALVSQIPTEKFKKNAQVNLKKLESLMSPVRLGEYLIKNPLVLAMKSEDLYKLVDLVDQSENRSEYLDKFIEFGRTLFASNVDFKPEEIFEKLVTNKAMFEIDVDKLNGNDCVLKFAEIFMNDDQSIVFEIEKLIKEKQVRMEKGEKVLRKRIRFVGTELEDLAGFVKDKDIKKDTKKEIVLSYARDIKELTDSRLALANVEDFEELRRIEKENGEKIENLLNTLRDIFEQKRFNIGKKYQNSDLLFEKMMDYLGECFDDKEPISEIFAKEIAEKFVEIAKSDFGAEESRQCNIYSNDVHMKVEQASLVGPMKSLVSEIQKPQSASELKQIVVERK